MACNKCDMEFFRKFSYLRSCIVFGILFAMLTVIYRDKHEGYNGHHVEEHEGYNDHHVEEHEGYNDHHIAEHVRNNSEMSTHRNKAHASPKMP